MKQWYLVQFKPNAHQLAVRNLQRQGFETFLPMQKITRRQASGFKYDFRPLFPGYMFVCVDGYSAPCRKINNTKGVSRLVSFAGNAKPLSAQVVASIMLRCDANGTLLSPDILKPGDNVEVLTGPFAKFIATVETIDAHRRIWILIELMGQITRMHIASDQVQLNN